MPRHVHMRRNGDVSEHANLPGVRDLPRIGNL
jgi:hypothetical protein